MVCLSCGFDNVSSARFCVRCGVPHDGAKLAESLAIEAKTVRESLVEPFVSADRVVMNRLLSMVGEKTKSQILAAKSRVDAHDSARMTVESDITSLIILVFAGNGPITARKALFFQTIYNNLTSGILNDAGPGTAQFIEALAKPGSATVSPYKASLTMNYLEQYDAKNGSHFSDKTADFFVRLAMAAGWVDGPPSTKTVSELENIKAILQLKQNPQLRSTVVPIANSVGQESGSTGKATANIALEKSAQNASDQRLTLETLIAELNSLIGLKRIKQDVAECRYRRCDLLTFTDLPDTHVSGVGVKETTYYPYLSNLLGVIGKKLKPKVRCIIHPRGIGAGLPDGALIQST
jgi:hypothetical protein